jgi:trigger factor
MNITQESTGALTATVCIEVEKGDYTVRVEEKLRDYRKKVKMPGFREGKVPMGMVQKMYGKAVLADEINNMISEALQNYLDENEIQVLASPLPNRDKQQPIDFDADELFRFYFDIAIRPELNLNLETIEGIKLYEVEPGEKEVEEYIAHIRNSYGSFEDVGVAEAEDLVYCEIDEVNDAGETFNGGIHSHGHLMITKIADEEVRKQFIGATKDTVIRMNPMDALKDRTEVASLLNLKPEELQEPLNHFDFRVTNVRKHIPAAIDDKLLSEVFPSDNLQTEEDLRERVRKDIAASFKKNAEVKMFNDTLDQLLSTSSIELPDEFLKRWLLENNEDGKATPDEIENLYGGYADQLRIAMIRNHIIEDYKIDVKEEDFYRYIYKALGMPVDDDAEIDEQKKATVHSIMQNISKEKKQIDQIADRIIEEKIASLIISKVPYTKESITAEEFRNLVEG